MSDSLPKRKISRLSSYDYSSGGAYFVTICLHNREHLFGEINNGAMILNPNGHIAEQDWLAIPTHYPDVLIDEFIVMPNHFHGIIAIIKDIDGAEMQRADTDMASHVPTRRFGEPRPRTLSSIIGNFKSGVTRKIRENYSIAGRLWQTRFHDQIIRDEKELNNTRAYIANNPFNWDRDPENS